MKNEMHEEVLPRVGTMGALHVFVPRRNEGFSVGREDPLERAAQNVHLAVADFTLGVLQATTPEELHQIHKMVSKLVLALGAVESAALARADEFVKEM